MYTHLCNWQLRKLNERRCSYEIVQEGLCEQRESKVINSKRLAELTGVTETTIRNIENGRSCPSFKLSIMLAKLLNVDFETLWEYDFRNS